MTTPNGVETATAKIGARRPALRGVIAIDGPAAAGKTTVARALAARLGAIYLDTGLLYRAATLAVLRAGLSPGDSDRVNALVASLAIDIQPAPSLDVVDRVLLDGEDVSGRLRSAEIDRSVSAVSAIPGVRASLLPIQRRIAANGNVVIAGRDITTVVAPDAELKIYLEASPRERARRRVDELAAKGQTVDFETTLRDIERRDHIDSTRDESPLRAADDAILIDTDGRPVDAVVDEIARIARSRWSNAAQLDPRAARR